MKFRRCLFTFSIKHEIRYFHVVVVQKRERNVQKSVRDARAKLLFCLLPIVFMTFSLTSASLDPKVPINSKQQARIFHDPKNPW